MERGGEKWATNEKFTIWDLEYAKVEAFFFFLFLLLPGI